jgi:hypothetical protein
MEKTIKGKYLITADGWFYAPDGRMYRSAWGEVQIISDDFLGIKTNRGSTNWYAQIGSDKKHIIIAGCQIHYAVKCEEKPNSERCSDWNTNEQKGINEYERPTVIYIAE